MNIQKLLCPINKTIIDTISIINNNGKGVVFIVDESNQLRGVITDGDIRRALLSGIKLKDKVEKIIKPGYTSANVKESPEKILLKFNQKIKIIPIVDDNDCVVDFSEYSANINVPIASPDLAGNEFKYLMDAFISTWISSTGEYIGRFENNFSRYCQCKYGIAVSNGTAAIHLALIALGIGKGDEVIVPDLTFAASVNPVLYVGATPVIVDVEKDSWCIDPKEIEKAVTKKTKAIIPVHLYGQPCEMDKIMKIAKKYNLYVIEDCAEAHGAKFKGRKVGSFGNIGCFSFFANKIITTGEGGMCVTNSKELYSKICVLKDHGMNKSKKYWHDEVGYNYRMTNLQAAIGVAQLERIEDILEKRSLVEKNYFNKLSNVSFIEFQKKNLTNRDKTTWLICALIKNGRRDECIGMLAKMGIDTRPFFYPLSSMNLYKKYAFGVNPITKEISKMGINFPTANDLSLEKIEKIGKVLGENKNV